MNLHKHCCFVQREGWIFAAFVRLGLILVSPKPKHFSLDDECIRWNYWVQLTTFCMKPLNTSPAKLIHGIQNRTLVEHFLVEGFPQKYLKSGFKHDFKQVCISNCFDISLLRELLRIATGICGGWSAQSWESSSRAIISISRFAAHEPCNHLIIM